MEIIVGKTAGFCFGVKNAIEKTEKELETEKEICCLGELVHNKQVIEKLEKKGVKFIDNIEERTSKKVVIRAHGAEKQIYKIASHKNITLIDLTCPKVLFTHKIVEEYSKKGYYIFLIGKRKHPEIVATRSFCGTDYTIIEKIEEIKQAIMEYLETDCKRILILAQTTYNLNKFNEIVEEIKGKLPAVEIEVKNTICNSTQNRQKETIEIAKLVDAMIVIGGRNSSNSIELYETAKEYCKNTQFIEKTEELDLEKIKGAKKLGIMAGASTPNETIKDLQELLVTR